MSLMDIDYDANKAWHGYGSVLIKVSGFQTVSQSTLTGVATTAKELSSEIDAFHSTGKS
jgi:hypothetical protein